MNPFLLGCQFLPPINHLSNPGVLKQVCSLESPVELKMHLPETILGDPLSNSGVEPWHVLSKTPELCRISHSFTYILTPYFGPGAPCCLGVGREDSSICNQQFYALCQV